MTGRFLAMTVMLAALGGQADAQELASDPSQLPRLTKRGDQLILTDTGGERVSGQVTQVDASGIVLRTSNKQVRFDVHMVDTIVKPDSQMNGMLIGLAIGGGLGAIPAAAGYDPVAFPLVYGALGLGIGWAIDYFVGPRQRVIYTKSKTTVSVAPVFNHQHQQKGVLFTLRH
jgi:hypothetical protein